MSEQQGAAPKYKVLERLRKEAGVVDVFRAVQTGLNRAVELRLLEVDKLGDRSELLRFEREFRTLATLDHPGLYKVLDWGVLGKQVFYVTEFRKMKPLAELVAEGTVFESEKLFSIAGQLADVLAYLHGKGVVHRGLSLESVLHDPQSGRCAIAEFLMVKDSRLTDLTARGIPSLAAPLLTPEFLRAEAATAATDVFLLGALLYRLAAGREPVRQADFLKLAKVDAAGFDSLVEPLPAWSPDTGKGVPAPFGRLVQQCLSFDTASRPADGRTLKERLAAAEEESKADALRQKRAARRSTSASFPARLAMGVEQNAGPTGHPSVLLSAALAMVALLALAVWFVAR